MRKMCAGRNRQPGTRWDVVIIAGCIAGIVWQPPAYAYLDPGSAGVLGQLLVAIVAGAGATMTFFWGRIKSTVGRLFASKSDSE